VAEDSADNSGVGGSGAAEDYGGIAAMVDPEFEAWVTSHGRRSSRIGDGWRAAGWRTWAAESEDDPTAPATLGRWNNLLTLLGARDEKLVAWLKRIPWEKLNLRFEGVTEPAAVDVEGAIRLRWLASAGIKPLEPDELVLGDENGCRFLIIGDPGDGSYAQHAVAKAAIALDGTCHTAFEYLLSDVIYPAGAIADYRAHFSSIYEAYPRPLYAVSGNHDWDDGAATAFMWQFCDVPRQTPDPCGQKRAGSPRPCRPVDQRRDRPPPLA
jgi:hypothetical protein